MVIVHNFSPTNWNIWFDGTPYNTKQKVMAKTEKWCYTSNADVCYNLAYFNMSNGNPVNYVKAKGIDCGYGGVSEHITVSQGNVCGGYAVGIRDNDVVIKSDASARTRNGIGITPKGSVIIAQTTTRITERNFCKEVLMQVNVNYKESIKLFLMEDGGGSTQMYSNISKTGINPEGGRNVSTVTCVSRRVPIKLHAMKVGSKGEDVRFLQMILGGLVCDGVYGNQTYKKVKEVQRNLAAAELYHGKIDGCVGPLTLNALGLA